LTSCGSTSFAQRLRRRVSVSVLIIVVVLACTTLDTDISSSASSPGRWRVSRSAKWPTCSGLRHSAQRGLASQPASRWRREVPSDLFRCL
jgi:hypothetical protein